MQFLPAGPTRWWGRAALATAAAAGVGTAACWAILLVGGWPYNHELLQHFERSESFRRAFETGDLFPLWTRFCFEGHGSPGPLFYPRLFFSVVGLLALAVGSTYIASKLAVVLFLIVGGAGTYSAASALGVPRLLRVAAAVLLMFAPYTMTNWLVRGAMAEFSAAMLVPWLLDACIRGALGRPFGLRLGITLVLLFYGHPLLFYYALVPSLLTSVTAAMFRTRRLGPLAAQAAATAGVVALLVGPYALAILGLEGHFGLEEFHTFHPTQHMRPWWLYVVDPTFDWGRQWHAFSVELGRGVLVGVGLMVIAAVAGRRNVDLRGVTGLLATAAVFVLLQLPAGAAFYRSVPGASLIELPWRLIAFLTPIAILVLVLVAAAVASAPARLRHAAPIVVASVVAYQVWFSLGAQNLEYARYSREEIEARLARLDGPASIGEFLPRGLRLDEVPPRSPLFRAEGCAIEHVHPPDVLDGSFHLDQADVEVVALGRPCRLEISQFHSPLLAVEGPPADNVERTGDGTTRVWLAAGRHRVRVRVRGLAETLRVIGSAGLRAALLRAPGSRPLPALERSARVDLTDRHSSALLWEGWSWPGERVRWSDGRAAKVRFGYAGGTPAILEMEALPFLVPERLAVQRVHATLNGRWIGSAMLTEPRPTRISLVLPSGVLASRNALRLDLPDAARPARLGESTDYRLLGVGLKWIEIRDFPVLRPGSDVEVAQPGAAAYLGPGWSRPEEGFRWTEGERAELRFRLESLAPMTFALRLRPFVVAGLLEAQHVHLELNGRPLAERRLDEPRLQVQSFALPIEALAARNTLSLHVPTAQSPARLGPSDDHRRLGLAVESFRVDTLGGALPP